MVDYMNFPTDIFPSSSGYSGLPPQYRDQLLESIIPQLTSSAKNMPGQIDNYFNESMNAYKQQMNNTLKTNIPSAVNNLSNRGVLDSRVASDTLGNVASNANQDFATQSYGAALEAAKLKAMLPTLLSQIAGIGSSSATMSQDPTQMYQIFAQLMLGQM